MEAPSPSLGLRLAGLAQGEHIHSYHRQYGGVLPDCISGNWRNSQESSHRGYGANVNEIATFSS